MALEAFSLVGKIALDGAEKVKKGMEDLSGKAEKVGKKFQDAGKKTKDLGLGLAKGITAPIAAAGAAIFGIAKQTGDYADRILDLNAITGMSTDSIQEWQHVSKIAGVSAEAVTGASQMLTKQMTVLAEGTGKGSDALTELGLDFKDLEAATPDQRMDMMIGALQGIEDPAERARLGTDLFRGSYQELAPVLAMTGDQIDEAKQQANDLGSVMGEDALNEANNFRIEMEMLTTKLSNLGRSIAMEFMPIIKDILMPIIESAIEKFKGLADWFNGLDTSTKEWIVKIGMLAAILPIVLIVIGSLIGFIGTMITKVKAIITVIKIMRTAMLGLNLAMLANPITWIILGIIALIAIGVLLYKNWDTVKAKLKAAFEVIKKGWNDTKAKMETGIKKFVETVKTKFEDAKKAITTPIEKAWETIKGWVEKIKELFNFSWEIPKPKIPKVSLTMKENSWGIPYPSFAVKWNAAGAFFDRPTVLQGLGENGEEAIMPLRNRQHMQPFSKAVAENLAQLQGATTNTRLEVPIVINGRELLRAIIPDLDRELKRKQKRQSGLLNKGAL